MIHLEKPAGFKASVEVVSCFFEHDGEFLLLHRHESVPQGNTWGIPAGKMEPGESLAQAMAREASEEIGFRLNPSRLVYFKKLYIRYPGFDFIYHIFHYPLDEKPPVVLNAEHTEFRWAEPTEALKFDLIPDEDECIKLFYSL